MATTKNLYNLLETDIRFQEAMNSCMNCGVCTAICPASEFYDYDPRQIVVLVKSRDEEAIENLLKSNTIWYCGQCMSCKMRCPRGNFPGLLINVLRRFSQELGYFTENEKGRQQYALKTSIGHNILKYGYCIHPEIVKPEMHPEQGPIWKWVYDNLQEVYGRLGANLDGEGNGTLRKISKQTLDELAKIFLETGALDLWQNIETYSHQKAKEMNMTMEEYFEHIYNDTNELHSC
ncbi:MAG TPA: hypothetical protein DDX39_02595 [Bacteroidales bacterium]|nr:MAG: hypothetical protein A2W98_03610 [Bacteroidetes bacterium GWF2_33_38]OFY68200.1 MAG: hypothetical protein A2265_01360 [Bacteroidetes bacterium RIFOXYA12_FULL_33_9]OFY84850.1 MAG: hypothetical protein A2236_09250 [Bacteroidetes bacterium RIFOXYA2_FULL_33_7]HBF87505.1 hypothetical protein [Bacteroidales bacterium]